MKTASLVTALVAVALLVPPPSRALSTRFPLVQAASHRQPLRQMAGESGTVPAVSLAMPAQGATGEPGERHIRVENAPAPYRIAQDTTISAGGSVTADDATTSPGIPPSVLRTRFVHDQRDSMVPSSFFGVHETLSIQTGSDEDLAMQLARLRELNLGTLRFPFPWRGLFDSGSDCSRNRPNRSRIAAMRELLGRLPARIEVLGMLTQPSAPCAQLYGTDRTAFRQQYADYVKKVVTLFKDRVRAWDIWNEPNNGTFYLDPPGHNMWTAEQYYQDVEYPAARVIRQIDPTAVIVLGSVAANGVVGHRCTAKRISRQGSCPPPRKTGWYMHQNFFPELFDELNRHPELDPYGLFDKIGLHPYYWTRFKTDGTRYADLTYVSPSSMTYGPGGLTASISVPGGTSKGVWWTELNEKLRLSVGNGEDGQASRFQEILTEALADSRRRQFPLELVTWFSLRDRGCENRARACWVSEKDQNGNSVSHRKWSGLIAYGTQGDPHSHLPRKVFYVLKNFVAAHTAIDYIIDDFTSKSVVGEAFNGEFWDPSCTALNDCRPLFEGARAAPDALRMHAPARTYGPWTKVALTSRHHIEIADKERVNVEFDFDLPASQPGADHYAVVSLGNKTDAPDAIGTFVLLVKRRAGQPLRVELLQRSGPDGLLPLLPWTAASGRCSQASGQPTNHARLVLHASGAWELTVEDAGGNTCMTASDASTGTEHAMSFARQSTMAISLTGISQAGDGDFGYDNVRLEGFTRAER